jgi:flavin-dependent dehydrogenase
MTDFDAIVVGTGVAAASTAIRLRSLGWRVAIVERRETLPCCYESISGFAVQELSSLSINIGFPISKVSAWWGGECEHHAYYPQARIVERAPLIGSLRNLAAKRGVESFAFDSRFELTRADERWRVTAQYVEPRCQRTLCASYIVDATGRASIVGKRLGSRRISFDNLSSVSFAVRNPSAVGIWTETTHDGWWNACSEPGGGTISFFCAPNTVREAFGNISRYFEQAQHVNRICSHPGVPSLARNCSSSALVPCAGPGWMAVGDAAWSAQPVASAGISKALRDARLATEVLQGHFAQYERLQRAEFNSYRCQLKQHYCLEQRWINSPFWQAVRTRETSVDWEEKRAKRHNA